MATGFQLVSYTTDAGTVGRIRMSSQARTAAGQGPLDTAVTDPNLFAFAQNPGSKRKKQLNARGLVLGRTVGVAPNQFIRRTFLPITTVAALAAIAINAAYSLGGVDYTVRDKINEA